ncbi:sensor histidine kinase [Chitinophaga barathri]|uniref:Signal transduction histidine kinase internal region domain-containing protein n=1 Tax=Chitinophaga barathri TaxID=1647451 RepID=A0A3N4M748_9BACT|nr:histidine kinase [Chitinophaga barathri]RPD39151.1 hypothetical protein EG028_21300 [Chitinophaga barathri]
MHKCLTISLHIFPWATLPEKYQPEKYIQIPASLLNGAAIYAIYFIALVVTVYYAYMFFCNRKKYWKRKVEKELKEVKRNAEISFLSAQLSPHFIFNCLNFIYCSVEPCSAKAADAVIKLSELMQYTMRENPDGCIALTDEIKHIRNYIRLVQLRYEPDCYVQFEIKGEDMEDIQIPIMILIPFVENAIKHGVVHDPDNPVHISLDVTGSVLTFSTQNLKGFRNKLLNSGVGIQNIRKRLQLLYPRNHKLEIEDNSNLFNIILVILL